MASSRPRYATGTDKNHKIPLEYLRDRCGGFESHKEGKAPAYTANFRGCAILLIDVSKYGGFLTDWIIQCLDNSRMFWLESKTPEAYKTKNHDMTNGELWLSERVSNLRFCVRDEDMEEILNELTSPHCAGNTYHER